MITPRKRLDAVDFDFVRSWMSACRESHGECNRSVYSDAAYFPMQVLNCDTAEIEPGSKSTKYAALSYVWGKEASQVITKDHSRFSSFPLLMRDAMFAAKKLGLKYLWVDRYCISKSDPLLKHEQIKNMDHIYERAEVTLVALVDDPFSGLPGVSTHSRATQPFLKLGRSQIIGAMHDPKELIWSSKWWRRAWTFQEALLSKRRLYFTHEQVYFEC
ncbi:HET-domain-containing protein, partial [Aulographum hederae CBS 113979]